MNDILLDYAFKVNAVTPLPNASTAFLRQALAVVKPKDGVTAEIKRVTQTEVKNYTDNADVDYLFRGGLSYCYILPTDTLNVAEIINAAGNNFYTVLISSDFSDAEVAELDLGSFEGVVGRTFNDELNAKTWNLEEKKCGFYGIADNGAKNMFFAFGRLLSATPFKNQQYIEMPFSDGVVDLGMADIYFDDRVSFTLTSPQYGNRLALFCAGGKAITAPYVMAEITIALQSRFIQYAALNQPDYTITEATLLESSLQSVLDDYIEQGVIDTGVITISLGTEEFKANGNAVVPEPSALWRVTTNLIQGVL